MAVAGVAIGRALVNGHASLAVVVCLVPLAAWLWSRPDVPLILLGASLPVLQSVTGGRLGYQVAISDLLLVLLGATVLFRVAVTGSAPEVRALRPVALPVLVYGTIMVLLLPLHIGIGNVLQTGQRFELFLVPLVVGAFAALSNRHLPLLQAYVLSTTVLAVVWPLHDFGASEEPGRPADRERDPAARRLPGAAPPVAVSPRPRAGASPDAEPGGDRGSGYRHHGHRSHARPACTADGDTHRSRARSRPA